MLAAYRSWNEEVLAYAPSDGFLSYRQGLAAYYDTLIGDQPPTAPEEFVVTVAGSEALLFALAATCDVGDELIVCEPFYTNYAGFCHLLGITVVPVTCRQDEGYRIDPAAIEAAITPRTRAIVIPTPGNPTGVVLESDEIAAIAAVCRRHGIFYISDEVYREMVYDRGDAAVAPSLLSIPDMSQLAIIVDSVSKRYSACGARVGWLYTRNTAVRSAALRFGQARLSPTTVDQRAAEAALKTPQSYFDKVIAEYRNRRDVLVEALGKIGIACDAPAGAFYLPVTLPVADADDFCQWMLTSFDLDGETVMFAPMSGFYATEGLGCSAIRIAYVLGCDSLRRCVEILHAALQTYPGTRA
jgi:aspartate aminotransferase